MLKSLAFLLRQRLRSSDEIGRFGGDEFTVILPDTSGSAASRLMDTIRGHFAKLDHVTGDGRFRVTLSCGVALISTADRALYVAKGRGGDSVELASGDG